jgi:uncharacterized repeat protein (TIGR03803 family)
MRPTALCLSVALVAFASSASAAELTTLYNFTGGADGAYPTTGLLRAEDGTLYGTTEGEDAKGNFGTVFRLNPPATEGGNWTKDNLYNFAGGRDGAYPWTRPIFDMETGALLGTTAGQNKNPGTVFRLIPGAHGVLPWKQQIIHRFTGGADSGYSYSALVQDPSSGAVYGTTYGETTKTDYGSIFGFAPDTKHKKWTSVMSYDFTAQPNTGAYPEAGLTLGPAGTLYGTTTGGGVGNCTVGYSVPGCGTIFSLNEASRTVTVLYEPFGAEGDGIFYPYGQLLADDQFNLYGATPGFSTRGCKMKGYLCGTVFSFNPDNGKPAKTIAILTGKETSGESYAGLTWDITHTVLFGTASFGGANKCPSVGKNKGCGFVFKLVQDGNRWFLTVVHEFTGGADGAKPHDLVIDTNGTLYGEAEYGGTNDVGTIFKIENP